MKLYRIDPPLAVKNEQPIAEGSIFCQPGKSVTQLGIRAVQNGNGGNTQLD